MATNGFGKMVGAWALASLVVLGSSGSLNADDTEIYRPAYRPNILIVFDDSGSMGMGTDNPDDPSRMVVAKNAIKTVIDENPGIDFGLTLFNRGYTPPFDNGHDGGRIVKGIFKSDSADERNAYRAELRGVIDQITAEGSTPMCESTYEAYRYLAGLGVVYGDQRNATYDVPDRDTEAESPALTYVAPTTYCAETYIVLITDGEPQFDTEANQSIKDLVGKTSSCGIYPARDQGDLENCLPELAEYMANTDLVDDPTSSKQIAITYTIGFTTDQELLSDVATNGGGKYYKANDAAQLAEVLGALVGEVSAASATLTSPSISVDSFTQTRSRDDVIFSMFTPLASVDWPGNIKKLKVNITDGVAKLVNEDPNEPVIDSSGEFIDGSSTFWSSGDGGEVTKGGVGELLLARDPTDNPRELKTNSGSGGELEVFDSANLDADAYGFADDADLFAFFGVDNQAQVDAVINWGKGYEVADDGSVSWPDPDATDYQTNFPDRWILADMLHSQPLVVNYGALGTHTVDDPDLRIVVGTNAGFLHMFGNNDGEEDWAFFPKELAAVLALRAEDAVSTDHVYGIDASPVLYTRDLNHDGTIDVDDDHAWVFFGLRRGGSTLYALDISDPDDPDFMWRLDETTAGFSDLGQTWSDPVVTRIPGHVGDDGIPKPVLVFGAGYDVSKDEPGIATPDTKGRGIYIVDAQEGYLVWGVTPAADSPTNLEEDALEHSVAARVTPLDSNGDGLTDRIYFADTGGNVWRVDLPGECIPDDCADDQTEYPWQIVKLAEMNGGTVATDRRFFNAPDLVRTSNGDVNFEAVLIGSGDRTNPSATDVDNQFYMIRDRQLNPFFDTFDDSADCDDDDTTLDDLRCDWPVRPADLYDVLGNLLGIGDDDEKAAATEAFAKGWRLDLLADGEKNVSDSLTIAGTIYFSTYAPGTNLENVCTPAGAGRLYGISLYNASAAVDFNLDGSVERSWIVGTLPPDTPSPYIDEDGDIWLLLPPGSGGGEMSNPFLTGASIPDPYGLYWYREEY